MPLSAVSTRPPAAACTPAPIRGHGVGRAADRTAWGGLFKGLELGLVDFPACVDGEEVYLCWQYGEKEIAFYHKRDEGFADRWTIGARMRQPQYEQ